MLIGEASCTKDLIQVTNHDFNVSEYYFNYFYFHNYRSGAPFHFPTGNLSRGDRVCRIYQFGNSILYQRIPSFVAPICISTIQLGAELWTMLF